MRLFGVLVAFSICLSGAPRKKGRAAQVSALDTFIHDASSRAVDDTVGGLGSLWSPAASLADLARDDRATQVDDVLTIQVSEQASAVATGTVKTSRTSSANASVTSLAGPKSVTGPLGSLLNTTGTRTLDGQGTATRNTTLTTSLSARVVRVLPNGYLVVEGTKQIAVDSEHQTVTVRGVVRPVDISTGNQVASTRLAEMEVLIDGKGVVSDATRRPLFLYRLLLGLLPF